MDPEELVNIRSSKYRRDLRNSIIRHYSLEELRILAHDLSVEWDSLSGETKTLKVMELIDHLSRRNLLHALNRQLRLDRPNIDWPGFPNGSLVLIDFEYEASGKTLGGKQFANSGKASIQREIEGEYYDDGLAFAEAVNSTANHVYIFEVEKKGLASISEFHISIYKLDAAIYLPDTNTE